MHVASGGNKKQLDNYDKFLCRVTQVGHFRDHSTNCFCSSFLYVFSFVLRFLANHIFGGFALALYDLKCVDAPLNKSI